MSSSVIADRGTRRRARGPIVIRPVARILAAVLVALAAPLPGCRSSPPDESARGRPPPPPKPYPDGAAGLGELWGDILTAARRDERDKVHELMASMMMTGDDLAALFGDERGRWLQPRYVPMVSRLVNVGAMELVAQIADRKYDDVEVFAVDARSPEPTDRAVLAALKQPLPVYGVRVKRKGESRGLRYDFFVYRGLVGQGGRWATGNQIGRYFVAAPDGGVPPIDQLRTSGNGTTPR